MNDKKSRPKHMTNKIKQWTKTHPEMWPALLVLPFSSILAALIWLAIKFWSKKNIT